MQSRRKFLKNIFGLLGTVFLPTIMMAEQKKLPKVLIIGDSISIGFTPFVKEILSGKGEVFHNKGNAQATSNGLEKLDSWLNGNNWDVIHFNWGLWDLCYRNIDSKVYGNRDKESGTLTTSLEQYEVNMEKLVIGLKETGAKLIFATTTPVPEGEAGRFPQNPLRYNAIALTVMREHGVAINDLFSYAEDHMSKYQIKEGDVHFTKEGYQFLAKKVAQSILNKLS